MKDLIDQINNARAKELAGFEPMADRLDRSVIELLEEIDGLSDDIRELAPEAHEQAIQICCLVSMVRVKLGFPASVHLTKAEAGGAP